MTVKEMLAELQLVADKKVKAMHVKNGAPEEKTLGVKMGDIRRLARKVKADNDFALRLWNTGIVDARLAAILLMKPNELSIDQLEGLVVSIEFAYVADWFSSYVLKEYPQKDIVQEKWLTSPNKWTLRSAWSLMAGKIAREADGLELDKLLDRLEKQMPEAAPEVQWTMNIALAYIGIHHANHRKKALEIGHRLGLYKDYPVSKGCTSPYAPVWINEMVSRQTQ